MGVEKQQVTAIQTMRKYLPMSGMEGTQELHGVLTTDLRNGSFNRANWFEIRKWCLDILLSSKMRNLPRGYQHLFQL